MTLASIEMQELIHFFTKVGKKTEFARDIFMCQGMESRRHRFSSLSELKSFQMRFKESLEGEHLCSFGSIFKFLYASIVMVDGVGRRAGRRLRASECECTRASVGVCVFMSVCC